MKMAVRLFCMVLVAIIALGSMPAAFAGYYENGRWKVTSVDDYRHYTDQYQYYIPQKSRSSGGKSFLSKHGDALLVGGITAAVLLHKNKKDKVKAYDQGFKRGYDAGYEEARQRALDKSKSGRVRVYEEREESIEKIPSRP
jgi:hypothetical protein